MGGGGYMSIIEKLGINPLKVFEEFALSEIKKGNQESYSYLSWLEDRYKKTVEILILVMDERFSGLRKSTTGQSAIGIIEKTTGKDWEDLKQIVDKTEV